MALKIIMPNKIFQAQKHLPWSSHAWTIHNWISQKLRIEQWLPGDCGDYDEKRNEGNGPSSRNQFTIR